MSKASNTGKRDDRRSIGVYGEAQAVDYLLRQGYEILGRNWRCRSGELDIIAKLDGTIVIVEVRTRRASGRFGTAAESVDYRKQHRVRSIAEVFLSVNKLHGCPVRFDVIAITLAQTGMLPASYEVVELRHIASAF